MSTRCPLHFQFKIFPLSLIISSLTHPPLISFSDDSEVVAVNIKEEDLESDQDLKNVIGRVGVGDGGGSNGDGTEDGEEDGKKHSASVYLFGRVDSHRLIYARKKIYIVFTILHVDFCCC